MAIDCYLKFDKTIEGESVAPGFEKAIQVQSWSWGGSQTSSMGVSTGSGAGKVQFSDFSITTDLDKAIPGLLNGMAQGTHFSSAMFSAVKAGAKNKPYLTIKFEEVFTTSVSIGGSSEVPSVSISFTFQKYTMDYKIQDKEGNLTTGGTSSWDIAKNEDK